MTEDKIVSVLNDIIEYLRDSQNGFKESADLIKRQQLKSLFEDLSKQRDEFATSLSAVVAGLDGDPVKSGSMAAAAHRAFLDLKSLVTGGDTKAIVKEVDRGETAMIERYQKILQENLPHNVVAILQAQLQKIQNNLLRIKNFAHLE